jgi:hypothetical protein
MATNIFIGYFNPTWRPNYENIIISFSNILSLRVKCMQTLCFAAILEKHFEKISKVNELCDVIRWVAPKLQERILLRACYVS